MASFLTGIYSGKSISPLAIERSSYPETTYDRGVDFIENFVKNAPDNVSRVLFGSENSDRLKSIGHMLGDITGDAVSGKIHEIQQYKDFTPEELAWLRSEQSAQNQRDFEERMSNSAYQRAVSDLQAAGLNPILAYSQGPASTPSGSSASASSGTRSDSVKDVSSLIGSLAGIVTSVAKLFALLSA